MEVNQKRLLVSAKTVGQTLYNNKFKVILGLGLGYGAKKCYDLYVFIKPFLDIKNQLQGGSGSGSGGLTDIAKLLGGGGAGSDRAPDAERSESKKLLDKLLSEFPHLKTHLKLFRNTIKNINNTLIY